jgi:hypothetical protein
MSLNPMSRSWMICGKALASNIRLQILLAPKVATTPAMRVAVRSVLLAVGVGCGYGNDRG